MKRQLITIILYSTLIILFTSCDEYKNNKQIKLANEAIKMAANSDQTIVDLPFGLKFNMSKDEVKKYLSNLSNKSIVSNIIENSFEYKYPEYNGLISKVELFFIKCFLANHSVLRQSF